MGWFTTIFGNPRQSKLITAEETNDPSRQCRQFYLFGSPKEVTLESNSAHAPECLYYTPWPFECHTQR